MAIPPRTVMTQLGTFRLVTTGRLRAPVLEPLAATSTALADLTALEGVTNARLETQMTGLAELDPRELVFGRAGYTFINAAFSYTRPGGNRFNDESRGAWYCALAVRTALREVTFHLTRELAAVGRFDNTTEYAELIADFIGSFHDLRGSEAAGERSLLPDEFVAYPAGQALARTLRHEHAADGIVYPSVRDPGGTCLAVFHPHLVQNLRQGYLWRITWDGTAAPTVTRLS